MLIKIIKWALISLVLVVAIALTWAKLQYGNGAAYPDISTAPSVPDENFTRLIGLEFPPGMVAAGPNGRLFFTYHMLHRPERAGVPTLYEWVDGKAVPFPSAEASVQRQFDHAMGITVDQHNRLWLTIPGRIANTFSRVLAIDIDSGEIVFEHTFKEGEAIGSQDLRISPDGNTIYTADTGTFQFAPAYIGVLDIASGSFRKLLLGHESVAPQDWKLIRQNGKPHDLFYGFLDFRVGADGIAISPDGEWLYYAAMTHDSVYRIKTQYLTDTSLSPESVADKVEFLSKKPMSDGIELDMLGNLIITDVENGGLSMLTPEGVHRTLVKSDDISWSDSVTVAADGTIYFTDSELADAMDERFQPASLRALRDGGPYYIYKVTPNL